MSSKAKIKGYQNEIYIRDKHVEAGIAIERVPGSGMFGGKYTGDLRIPTVEHPEFIAECKVRKNGEGFKVLEEWMGEDDIMFIKRTRQDPMVVLTWPVYLKLMRKYYNVGD